MRLLAESRDQIETARALIEEVVQKGCGSLHRDSGVVITQDITAFD